MGTILNILLFILILGILVFVHELGHFLTAKKSGVYIHGCYELQVLDSFGKEEPQNDDCGGIYQNYKPRVNACKPALEWQTYDIIFRAPRFENGNMTEAARATILQNGTVIHNNLILHRATPGGVTEHTVAEGPLMLQDHGNPVKFRNIWIETL